MVDREVCVLCALESEPIESSTGMYSDPTARAIPKPPRRNFYLITSDIWSLDVLVYRFAGQRHFVASLATWTT